MKHSQLNTDEELSLDNCDKEPVHIPGHIQNIAVLIAVDEKLERITHCTDNAELFFDHAAKDLLGKKLNDVLDRELIHDLNNTLSLSSAKVQRERVTEVTAKDTTFEVWAHYSNGCPVLEIEPVHADIQSQFDSIRDIRSLLTRIGQTEDLKKSLDYATEGLRSLSGFDRVMLYQFDSNGDGEVKAEAKGAQLESFFGLRFPAWDIPKQAREIMKKLPMRMIADVHGTPIPLLQINSNLPPLDLTLAACRGQSPVHSEYLNNMGVDATMSLSIVIAGELWGLFAFHHMSPRNIGPALRAAAELFSQFFCLQMEQRLQRDRYQARVTARRQEKRLLESSGTALSLIELIKGTQQPLCDLVRADGVAVIIGAETSCYGSTPDAENVSEICHKLLTTAQSEVVSTNSLHDLGFSQATCAGALALILNKAHEHVLIFFRDDAVLSVEWAGSPKKNIEDAEDGPRLKPRGSFKAYSESVKNRCQPWEESDIAIAEELHSSLTKAEAQRLNSKVDRQRAIYIEELNHRVRNILALIRSLARQTHATSDSLESYAKSLERRIASLAAAHDLAANRIATGIVINEIFEMEAQPFIANEDQQLTINGEKYVLRSDVAPIFTLIAHELMTNCVKHGSLSVASGRVDISITTDEELLKIIWLESNGPAVKQPDIRGFGLDLIENIIPYELDGESQIEFLADGLQATFTLPVTMVKPFTELPQSKITKSDLIESIDGDVPKQVLIVEDSMMIALDMSDMLEHIGIDETQKCASVAQAKQCLETFKPDFALLDISLRDEQSFEVAELLRSLKVPFCFATGYGSSFGIPDKFQNVTILTKPVDVDRLKYVIKKLYGKSA